MGLQRWPLKAFLGGVNLIDSALNLESDEAQAALNVSATTERGSGGTRKGKTAVSTTGFPTGKRIENMHAWTLPNGTKLLICSIDGDIYSMTTGGAFTQRFNGTAGTIWDFETSTDGSNVAMLWAINGTDSPQKWDGATANTVAWTNTPPAGTMLKVWKNRMCISGVSGFPARVFFSDIGNPESPASGYGTNWIDIKSTEDDKDEVTWLEILADVLLVFKRRSVWSVYDPTAFTNQRLGGPGCEARFQSCVIEGRCFYLAREDGVYSVNQNSAPFHESRNIAPFFQDETNHAQWAKARVVSTHDRRVLVAVCQGTASSNNYLWEGIPEMNQEGRRFPWFPHDFPVESMTTFRLGNEDEVLAGASNADKLHRLFEGTSDDGVAINSYWFTPWYKFLAEEPLERIRRLNIMLEGKVTVDIFQDFNDEFPQWSKTVETAAAVDPLWDGGTWDGGPWEPEGGHSFLQLHPEKRGRYHAFRFRVNELNKAFHLHEIEVALRGGKEHTK